MYKKLSLLFIIMFLNSCYQLLQYENKNYQEIKSKYSVKAKLLYKGKNISEYTNDKPYYKFFSPSRSDIEHFDENIFYENGFVYIKDLLENKPYSMVVIIDANKSNEFNYPGDYIGSIEANLNDNKKEINQEVKMQKIIRLLKPIDSNKGVKYWGNWCNNSYNSYMLTLQGNIEQKENTEMNLKKEQDSTSYVFEWEKMGDDIIYNYSIEKIKCGSYEGVGIVKGGETKDNNITIKLPKSDFGEYYAFRLSAKYNEEYVGIMVIKNHFGLSHEDFLGFIVE